MDQTVMPGRLLLLREEGGGNADHIHCCEERHHNEETMKVRVSEHPVIPWRNVIVSVYSVAVRAFSIRSLQ